MLIATLLLATAATLCVGASPCVPFDSATPLPQSGGPFLLRSADGRIARIGVLPANGETHAVEFAVAGAPRVQIRANEWSWDADVSAPNAKVRIETPAGEQPVITISADGFDPFTITDQTALVRLRAQPLLSGRVLDGTTKKVLPGAAIVLPGGKELTRTSRDGSFRARVPGEWPHHISVSMRGRGTRVINLPKRREDTALPEITLRAASSIDLVLDNRASLPANLTWQVVSHHGGPNADVLQRGELAAGANQIHIEDVAEGNVAVNISGPGPLQRFGVLFELRDGDAAEQHVTISPSMLIARVLAGDAPVPHAKLSLLSWNARWEAIVTTDDDGVFRDELWETGSFAVATTSATFPNVYVENRDLAPAAEIRLDIALPDHRIVATVVDRSGKPVPHARAWCEQFVDGKRQPIGSGITDDAGTVTFAPARAGRSVLRVSKDGVPEPSPLAFDVVDGEREKTVRVVLDDAEAQTLTVVDARNQPIAGASVIVAAADGVLPVGVTSADGTLRISLADPRNGTIFVVPPGSGLAYLRLATSDGDAPKIVVPDATATLQVTALDTTGAPIPNIAFLLQWNGVLLPVQVQRDLEYLQGLSFRTNADGVALLSKLPPGFIELWPLTSREELERVLSIAPPPAAASIQLNRGRQSVVMKFTPARTP